MTLTLTRRPAPLLSLLDDRDTGPRMTEAAYAEAMRRLTLAEGQRGAPPPDPAPKNVGRLGSGRPATRRVLHRLKQAGPTPRGVVGTWAKIRSPEMAVTVAELIAAGLIREEAAPLPSHPRRVVLVLTDAGRAAAEETP